MKTEAAILNKLHAPLQIVDVELQKPKAHEVLVKMVASGICHTDISVINGAFSAPLPIILGHEGAGVVIELGPKVTELKVGDHVLVTPLIRCGSCRACLEGRPCYCTGTDSIFAGPMLDGTTRFSYKGKEIFQLFCQGSFAAHTVVCEKACVKIQKDIPLEKVAPLACGVSTGAGAVLNVAKVKASDKIAIFGCGGVGLSAIMAAKLQGALIIIAVDVSPSRLKLAKRLGATHLVFANKVNPVEKIKEITAGGVDYAFECIGKKETILQSIATVRLGGSAVISGALSDDAEVAIDGSSLIEKNILGNLAGSSVPDLFIPMLINHWKKGDFPLDAISKTYSFNKINNAIQDMLKGKVVKPIILFSQLY